MNSDGSQWFRRERFDLVRPLKEALKPSPIWLIEVEGSRVKYVQTNGTTRKQNHPKGDEEDERKTSVGDSVAVTVGKEVSA